MLVCEESNNARLEPTQTLSDIGMRQSGTVRVKVVEALWLTTAHGKVATKLLLRDSTCAQFEAHLSPSASKSFAGLKLERSDWLQVNCEGKRKAWSNEHFNGSRSFPYPYNKMTYIVNVSSLSLSD